MIFQVHVGIIIGGKDEQEHDLTLRKVLSRAQLERNIKFSRDKIQFRASQIKLLTYLRKDVHFQVK